MVQPDSSKRGIFLVIIFLLLQHAPLHCVLIYARFVLLHVYMIVYCGGFLFLDVLGFCLTSFSLQFFEIYRVSECCNLF